MNRCKKAGIGIVFSAFIVASSLFTSKRLLERNYVDVGVNGLPPALDGLRILHITDLHANNPEKQAAFFLAEGAGVEIVNIWQAARGMDFDIVVLTGDIVDENAYQLEPHLPYIKALASEYPVFFCEGNHDWPSMKKLRKSLEQCGVTVLVGEKCYIELNSEEIEVIGLSDWYNDDYDASSRLFVDGAEDGKPGLRIVLSHQPQHSEIAEFGGIPCIWFSGHTHGGQLRIPFMPTIYAPGQGFFPKFGDGVYELDDSGSAKMFVSRGIGATGKAPYRFWNRPEINVVTLTSIDKLD